MSSISSCSSFHVQVLELVRNPEKIEDVMCNEESAILELKPERDNPEPINGDSHGLQKTEAEKQEHGLNLSQVELLK